MTVREDARALRPPTRPGLAQAARALRRALVVFKRLTLARQRRSAERSSTEGVPPNPAAGAGLSRALPGVVTEVPALTGAGAEAAVGAGDDSATGAAGGAETGAAGTLVTTTVCFSLDTLFSESVEVTVTSYEPGAE